MRVSWFFVEAFKSIKRNWVMSLASILTVALSLSVVGVFMFGTITLNELIGTFEKQVEIEVFLLDSAEPKAVESLQEKIISWSEIDTVRYISKEEALERFKQRYKDQPELIENLPGNPLPASFVVRLKDPKQVEKVAKRFDGNEIVDEVEYGKKYVDRLFEAIKVIRYAGITFITLLAFVSIVLIVLTIRLAIYARRQEIAIMRLVGASNWFIRIPFIIEGCVQGFIGALLAAGSLYLLKISVFQNIKEQLLWLPLKFEVSLLLQISEGLVIGGLAIGAIGSTIALRRFLKV